MHAIPAAKPLLAKMQASGAKWPLAPKILHLPIGTQVSEKGRKQVSSYPICHAIQNIVPLSHLKLLWILFYYLLIFLPYIV